MKKLVFHTFLRVTFINYLYNVLSQIKGGSFDIVQHFLPAGIAILLPKIRPETAIAEMISQRLESG